MAVDFNPMLARSLASEQNMANSMYDIGSLLADKGYFPGKFLGRGLGLLGGAVAGLPNRMAPLMKDDSGWFQGGEKGRLFGRFRDEVDEGYEMGKEKGILGLSMKAEDKVKPVKNENLTKTQPSSVTSDDFVYENIEDMPYIANKQDYEMRNYNIPDKYWYDGKTYTMEDYPGTIFKAPSGKVNTGQTMVDHLLNENIVGWPYRVWRDWDKPKTYSSPRSVVERRGY